MLRSFCIKSNKTHIINHIAYEVENSEFDGLYITCKSFKNYNNVIIHYKGDKLEDFYAFLSGILSNTIVEFYEENLVYSFISAEYFYFSNEEKKEIFKYCLDELECSKKDKLLRINYIFSSCFDYIKENKSMVMDGFVNFRLKEYKRELDEIVDLSVDKFVLDKEYLEFTSLLRLYVNSKEPEEEIIHLVYQSGESKLLNCNKQIIDMSSSIFDAKYLSDISFSSNDYALNALLNLLPRELFIHLIDGIKDEFIETLELIFENRVHICEDCAICKIFRISEIENNKTTFKK